MNLYCIRHGESVYNADGRIQGQEDIPLSPLGLRQSAALAGPFESLPIQAIYCSPLQRALQTAQPLADLLRLKIISDDRLMEIHAGVFQGLTWPVIEVRYPSESSRWKSHELDFVIPGGESRSELQARGMAVLNEIRAAGHEQVVVVSHGGLLSAALKGLLQIPEQLNPFRFYNAAINQFEWEDQLKIVAINRVEHLRAINADRATRTGDL